MCVYVCVRVCVRVRRVKASGAVAGVSSRIERDDEDPRETSFDITVIHNGHI